VCGFLTRNKKCKSNKTNMNRRTPVSCPPWVGEVGGQLIRNTVQGGKGLDLALPQIKGCPISPDFPRSLLALMRFMRLSSMKAAHAVVS
jgi:hypothetical protein